MMPMLLRRTRKNRGLSQIGLAEVSGLDASTIARYENGTRVPTREALQLICDALKLSDGSRAAMYASFGYLYDGYVSVPSTNDESQQGLVMGLDRLKELQEVALREFGHDNLEKDTLARYGTALMIEAAEFVNETGWKVWKTKPADLDKVKEEFVDLLHFIGTWLGLMGLMGITPADIADAFETKYAENRARFEGKREGYRAPRGYDSDENTVATNRIPEPDGKIA